MSTEQTCNCGRPAGSSYGGKRWCCIQCFRFTQKQHTLWCDRRTAERAALKLVRRISGYKLTDEISDDQRDPDADSTVLDEVITAAREVISNDNN